VGGETYEVVALEVELVERVALAKLEALDALAALEGARPYACEAFGVKIGGEKRTKRRWRKKKRAASTVAGDVGGAVADLVAEGDPDDGGELLSDLGRGGQHGGQARQDDDGAYERRLHNNDQTHAVHAHKGWGLVVSVSEE
jgi:hypothetical protein